MSRQTKPRSVATPKVRFSATVRRLRKVAAADPLSEPVPVHQQFVVIIDNQIAYETDHLNCAVAFRHGKQSGSIFGRFINEYRSPVETVSGRAKGGAH